MSHRSDRGWLQVVIFLGVLVGVAAGGVMGGVAGYFAAQNAPTTASTGIRTESPPSKAATTPIVTTIPMNGNSATIDAVKQVEPAVVTIITSSQGPSTLFGLSSPVASGSGIIIDAQGHIVTNDHVLDGANGLEVILRDGSKLQGSIVGADSVTDLAVVQVSGNVPAAAQLGDSDSLRVGETVLAIGSPLGNYRGSVTLGVVSGINRTVGGTMQEGLLQSDAAINQGNDGGPLVNLLGQVIGINTLVVRATRSGEIAEGLGFGVPSNTVREVSRQIISVGKVEYPYIGIVYQPIKPQLAGENDLPSRDGLLLMGVAPGSPGGTAGLRRGDIVLALDGDKIDQNHSFRSLLFAHKAGEEVTLTIVRAGDTRAIKITLVERPPRSSMI